MINNLNSFIKEYNQKQADMLEKFSPFIVREFSPATFLGAETGYATEIKSGDEVWKFADCMHETRYEENMRLLGGALSHEEFKLAKEIVLDMLRLTSAVDNPVVVKNALTRTFLHLRGIKSIAKLKNKKIDQLTVLEIGPGSGYLGLLCRKNNIKYFGLEITQSLYMHQHFLWESLGDNELKECMITEDISGEVFAHIPWWTFADQKLILPDFDVVVINHAVNEISPACFKFEIKRLIKSFENGLLMVEGWGGGSYNQNCLYLEELGASFLHQSHAQGSKFLALSVMQIPSEGNSETSLGNQAARTKWHGIGFIAFLKYLMNQNIALIFMKRVRSFYKRLVLEKRLYKFLSAEVITEFSTFFLKCNEEINKSDLDSFYLDLKSKGLNLHTMDEEFIRFINNHSQPI